MTRIINKILAISIGLSFVTVSTIARSATYNRSIVHKQLLAQERSTETPEANLLKEAFVLMQQESQTARQQALAKLKESLKLYEAKNDKQAQLFVLGLIINLSNKLGDNAQAEKYTVQASKVRSDMISQVIQNSPAASKNPGIILSDNQNKFQNVESLLYKSYIGFETQVKLGNYQLAINHIDKILEDVNRLAPVYTSSGKNDEYQKLLVYVQQMHPIYKGYLYYQLGDYQKALDYAAKISSTPTAKEVETTAVTLFYQGKLYYQLGEYQKALDYSRQSLSIFKRLSVSQKQRNNEFLFVSEPEILIQIGKSYDRLSNNLQALNSYNEAFASSDLTEKTKAEIFILKGDTYNKTENRQEAFKNYKQALSFYTKNLKSTERRNTDFSSIKLGIQELNEILTDTSPKLQTANIIYEIGKIYQELGDNKQAINYLTQASSNFKAIHKKSDEALARFDWATILKSEGKLKQALSEIETAIKISEDTRTKITNPNLRISYLATVQSYYRLKIDLLMQLHKQEPNQGYNARALETSESARARGLLDLLTEAKADIKQGVDPQLLAQERAIQKKLDAVKKRRVDILSRNETIPADLQQEIISLDRQSDQNKDQIRLKSPRYAAITQPQPLKLAQIQQLLDDNTVLLEYSLGEERSYLWLVTKTSINSYQLPKSAEINSIVYKYRRILRRKVKYATTKIEIDKIAPQLKEILFGNIADKLTNKRLVVIADGALQYLPFGALPTAPGNQPLLLTNEVINLPSASTLGILRKYNSTPSKAAKTVAVFADPVFTGDDNRITNSKVAKTNQQSTEVQSLQRAARENGIRFDRLPNTKTEAEAILKLVPSDRGKLNLNFAANVVNVSNPDLVNYRILHFATHGLMDGLDPTRSGLVLSLFNEQGAAQNGYLRLPNIFNLKLDADLVVLSACETGIGKEIQGEGVVTLTRGFMYAGTPRVLVSLWSVDDEATAILMGNFYTGILKQGLTPAAALRQAQQTMMRNLKYQSPYYWAAFTLQGEWK